MKFTFSIFILFCFYTSSFSQDSIKMKISRPSENKDLQAMMSFEGIAIDEFQFSGKQLKGKDYDLTVKEFMNGKLISTKHIFDSKEDEYFRIEKDTFKFKMLTKVGDDKKFKIELAFGSYKSKKLIFDLFDENGRYVMKSFLRAKSEINVPEKGKFYIMSLITPTLYKDGSRSYCDVAQSGVNPENLHQKFDVPHYFLIEMTLK